MSEHQNKIIYKKDSKGNIRVWWMTSNYDGDAHRTYSGLEHGLIVKTEWTRCKPKNIGKANQTTPVEQASAEIDAKYAVKLDKGYAWTVEALEKVDIFKPMLAQKYTDFINKGKTFTIGEKVYTQPKLDGIRCLVRFIDGKVTLWTRTGKAIPVSGAHIAKAMLPMFAGHEDSVYDGELYNHELKDDFNKIASLVRKETVTEAEAAEAQAFIQYHIYDMYDPRHPDALFELRNMQLQHNMKKHFFKGKHIFIKEVSTLMVTGPEHIENNYIDYLDAGYEGQMIRTNSPYSHTRSWGLLKRKEFTDAEFIITDILEGKGNWSGHAKKVSYKMLPPTKDTMPDPRLKVFVDGEPTIFEGGVAGNRNFCRQLLLEKDQYIGGQVTVTYFQPTPDGMPRFPVAKQFFKKGQDRSD